MAEVAERLDIRNHWVLFGNFWGEEAETLRSYKNKGMGMAVGGEFIDRLKEALKE